MLIKLSFCEVSCMWLTINALGIFYIYVCMYNSLVHTQKIYNYELFRNIWFLDFKYCCATFFQHFHLAQLFILTNKLHHRLYLRNFHLYACTKIVVALSYTSYNCWLKFYVNFILVALSIFSMIAACRW